MNNARVSFKHYGQNLPDKSDAEYFVRSVDAFLVDVSRQALDVDFKVVSLIDAVGHRRTQNWLEKAEAACAENRDVDALRFAAAALAVCLAHNESHDATIRHHGRHTGLFRGFSSFPDMDNARSADFSTWAGYRILNLQRRLHLLTRGVDVALYDRFATLTPLAHVDGYGELMFRERSPITLITSDAVRACIDFVIDTALALRDNRPPAVYNSSLVAEQEANIKRRCDVLIAPESSEPEVICAVVPGEVLALPRKPPRLFRASRDHVAVLHEGDIAYVRLDCVEIHDV